MPTITTHESTTIGLRKAANSIWPRISIFQNSRKISQQNVLSKIVLQNENENLEADVLEQEKDFSPPAKTRYLKVIRSDRRIISPRNQLGIRLRYISHSCGTFALLFALAVSLCADYLLIMTDWYEEQVLKEGILLKNNSIMFDYWKDPPVKPLISVYIFNYTNTEEALSGKEKLKVEEIGPYTFRETMERVNIHFHPNGTVSFQEKRSHEFVEELSTPDLTQAVITPNILAITAMAHSKSASLFARIGLTFLMKSLDVKTFHTKTVDEVIWGDDKFTNVASKMVKFVGRHMPSRIGLISSRIGVSPDVVTIYNGVTGFDKFGVISRFNGQMKQNIWSEECDRLEASDGTLFPPEVVRFNQPFYVYAKELCRRMLFTFVKQFQTDDGFPAVRYSNPANVFSRPYRNPNNACFCKSNECAPDGLQYTGPCLYGAPIYISMPHFLSGDPSLHTSVLGLIPDARKHTTYMDIHQKFGIPLGGESRLQMNIRLSKPHHFSSIVGELDDGIFLPVAWVQCEIGQLPPNLSRIVYHLTYSTMLLKHLLRILFALSVVMCCYYIFKRTYTMRTRKLCDLY